MISRRLLIAVAVLASAPLLAAIAQAQLGRDKIAFPQDYAKGVLYATLDRADIKQFRELWGPAAALDAAKAGRPLPDGTVLTLVQYAALPTAAGEPQKDANGRFIKGAKVGYAVMEKRAGWGAEYDDGVAQRRVGVSGVWRRRQAERPRQRHRLFHLPQAAGRKGRFHLQLRSHEGREITHQKRRPNYPDTAAVACGGSPATVKGSHETLDRACIGWNCSAGDRRCPRDIGGGAATARRIARQTLARPIVRPGRGTARAGSTTTTGGAEARPACSAGHDTIHIRRSAATNGDQAPAGTATRDRMFRRVREKIPAISSWRHFSAPTPSHGDRSPDPRTPNLMRRSCIPRIRSGGLRCCGIMSSGATTRS